MQSKRSQRRILPKRILLIVFLRLSSFFIFVSLLVSTNDLSKTWTITYYHMLQRKLVITFQANSYFYHQSLPTCIHPSCEELQRHWLQIRYSPSRSRPSTEDQGNKMYILQDCNILNLSTRRKQLPKTLLDHGIRRIKSTFILYLSCLPYDMQFL